MEEFRLSIIRYTFRVEEETIEKLRFIADNNFRTVNKELEKLVKDHIAKYEMQNGEIKINED